MPLLGGEHRTRAWTVATRARGDVTKVTAPVRRARHTAGMAGQQGKYWDLEQGQWVRFDVPRVEVEVPAQQTPVAENEEADVRSG